jgi:hypothetical protein
MKTCNIQLFRKYRNGKAMTTVKELIKFLQERYDPDDVVAYDLWSSEDVLDKAREMKIYMTKEQVDEALESIDRNKDAEIGITWYTIGNAVESFGDKINCDECAEYCTDEEKSNCNYECLDGIYLKAKNK